MKVSFGEAIEIVGKAGRGFEDPDDFFISSTNDKVQCILFDLQDSHSVDIVAMNLSPGNLVELIILKVVCYNSRCLIL